MEFLFRPIQPVIEEIKAILPGKNERGEIDDDICLMSARSALRLMGFHTANLVHRIIPINGFYGALPKDYYAFDDIFRIPQYPSGETCLRQEWSMRKSNGRDMIMLENDQKAMPHASSPSAQDFTINAIRGTIRVTFREGRVLLVYTALPKDEAGNDLMPDEENTVKAVKSHVMQDLYREQYHDGQLNGNVWQDIKNDWDTYSQLATNTLISLDNNDFRLLVAENRARYRNFMFDRPGT